MECEALQHKLILNELVIDVEDAEFNLDRTLLRPEIIDEQCSSLELHTKRPHSYSLLHYVISLEASLKSIIHVASELHTVSLSV